MFARRFSSAGTALASEFQVNTHTSGNQFWPWVAADSNGDFVIVWNSNHDGDFSGVFGRRFSSSGVALATEFQVNTYTSGVQGNSSVAADADGDFVVAWPSPQDGAGPGVFARRFSSAGVALATEFQVNTHTLASEYGPAVAAETDGDFVIAWRGLQDGSGYSAHARRFSSTGTPLATEFQINSHITFNQMDPAVAIGGDGDFVVAWPSQLQDGSSYGVFAQRFQPQRILDVDGDGVIAALTDGLLVLRFTFGFDGAVLTNGAVNLAGCTRCDASTIVPYLETLE